MKNTQDEQPHSKTVHNRGFALVVVLGFLVLITALIIAFFTNVTTDSAATRSFTGQVNVTQLADSAVQVVMGQISAATSMGTDVTWASQPGLIRTFGESGAGRTFFKLYSSDTMQVTSGLASFNPGSDVDTAWNSKPAAFTDLNAPEADADGTPVFPILDPTAAAVVSGGDTVVDGFSFSTSANGSPLAGAVSPSSVTDTAARVPMPVRWLYVLRDGQLIAPDGTSTNVATFNNAATRPSRDNPIVGRIAFWTDDETCKLNINTASEAVAWEPPSFYTALDIAMGQYQPALNEFNRYPGHPATTCLSPVLWSRMGLASPRAVLWPVPTGAGNNITSIQSPRLSTSAESYFRQILGTSSGRTPPTNHPLTSRMNVYTASPNSGSQAGTARTDVANISSALLNVDRIYSSVDELAFQPDGNGANRDQNIVGLTPAEINRYRFFLTASSRAPEVNLFGKPRIALWPIPAQGRKMAANRFSSAADNRSVMDKLIAFCSTANNQPYYFQRYDATSPSNDYTQIQRNRELFRYFRNLMNRGTPGFSTSSFQSRLTSPVCDQIATMMFDYVRSSVNLLDSSGTDASGNPGTDAATRYKFSYTVPPARYSSANASQRIPVTEGTGQVVPFVPALSNAPVDQNARGMGRFAVLRSAAFMFVAQRTNTPPVEVNQFNQPMGRQPGGNMTVPTITLPAVSALFTPEQIAKLSQTPPQELTGTGNETFLTRAQVRALINNSIPNLMHPFWRISSVAASLQNNNPIDDPFFFSAPYTLSGSGNATTGRAHANLATIPYLSPGNGTFSIPNTNYSGGSLAVGQTVVQPVLMLEFMNPSPGTAPLMPNFIVEVRNLNGMSFAGSNAFGSSSIDVPLQATANGVNNYGFNTRDALGSPLGVGWTLLGQNWGSTDGGLVAPPNPNRNNPYPLVGSTFVVNGRQFSFSGGNVEIRIWSTRPNATPAGTDDSVYPNPTFPAAVRKGELLQTITMAFPAATFPTPKLTAGVYNGGRGNYSVVAYTDNNASSAPGTAVAYFPERSQGSIYNRISWYNSNYFSGKLIPNEVQAEFYNNPVVTGNDGQGLGGMAAITINGTLNVSPRSIYDRLTADTIQAMEAPYGDIRLVAGLYNVPSNMFLPHDLYGQSGANFPIRSAHSLRGAFFGTDSLPAGTFVSSWNSDLAVTNANRQFYFIQFGAFGSDTIAMGQDRVTGRVTGRSHELRNVFKTATGRAFSNMAYGSSLTSSDYPAFATIWSRGGDFDNGIGMNADGAFFNKADEGVTIDLSSAYAAPYFQGSYSGSGANLHSPNRQINSAVAFGSIPLALNPANPDPNQAWQTLLFGPNPLGANHPSRTASPPDHLLLDLFWMPVVQPYAISEPFSTAGKVNMNYQIAPFTYIRRDTALRGVLKSVMLTAVAPEAAGIYKQWNNAVTLSEQGPLTSGALATRSNNLGYRFPVHLSQTLQQFETRFNNRDVFRSASEICSIFLYPASQSNLDNPTALAPGLTSDGAGSTANIEAYWRQQSLTGNNMRERPYDRLYPRLTTKSNTYTVHFRVQALRKSTATDVDRWDERRDVVLGDYRGSSSIERYIDPNDTSLPDFATNDTATIDPYYKFRVLNTKRFNPQ